MEQTGTCFVVMPFGRKTHPETRTVIDFDRIYDELIRPAVQDAGYTPVRADELLGRLVFKAALEYMMVSDVFLADVTTANPNVMYQLGLRHALRNAPALLIAANLAHLPFDISYSRVLTYAVDDGGQVIGAYAQQFKRDLSIAIRHGIGLGGGSPIYEFFPELHVDLPEELIGVRRKRGMYSPKSRRATVSLPSVSDSSLEIKRAEEAVKNTEDVDPAAAIDVLRRYHENSAWDDLIRFADELPENIRKMPQVRQITALSLNRRGTDADQTRAIHLMEQLLDETGGDAETYGILGSIYKGRFENGGDVSDLTRAVSCYRAGFEKQPSDFYLGINLVSLLAIYGGQQGEILLEQYVPLLQRSLMSRLEDRRADFWTVAAALELSVISGNWNEAFKLVQRMVAQQPTEWMLASIVGQLRLYRKSMQKDDRSQLDSLISLITDRSAVEESNA